jgi:hypothetical protein
MKTASHNIAQMKDKIVVGSIYGLLIALVFWIPDILIHAYSGKTFSRKEVLILTLLMPTLASTGLYFICHARDRKDGHAIRSIGSVLGIWITGPLFMMVSSSFSGSGFSRSDIGIFEQISFVITCMAGFPIFTFMMSTYDGTLFALLITTALLPTIGLFKYS